MQKSCRSHNEFDFKLLNTDLDATNGPGGRNSLPSDEGDD